MTFDPFFTQVIEQKDIDKVEKRTRVFSEMMGKGKQVAKFEWDEISFIKLLGQGGFCTVTKVRIGDQRQQENRRKNQNRSTISHEQQRRWSRRRAPPTRSPLPSTQQEEENVPKKEVIDDDVTNCCNSSGSDSNKNAIAGGVYALKSLNLVTIDQQDFVAAATDLLCEAALLSNLNHKNIITFRGMAKICSNSSSNNGGEDGENEGVEEINGSYQYEDGRGFFFLMDVLSETLTSRFARWRMLEKRAQRQQHRMKFTPRSPFTFGRRTSATFTSSPHTNKNHSPLPPSSPGSLKSTLAGKNSNINPPPVVERLQNVALGIAQGMKYLHDEKIVMRDLKPDNVGFQAGDDMVKIFDFGLARPIHKVKDIAGSWNYCAPEYMLNKQCSLSCDVYSFSLVLYELVSLQIPFDQYKNTRKAMKRNVLLNGERPTLDKVSVVPTLVSSSASTSGVNDDEEDNCNESIRLLIQECWDADPESRPTFSQIIHRLQDIISDIENSSSSWTEQEAEPPIAVINSAPGNLAKSNTSTSTASTASSTPGSMASYSPVRAAKHFFLSRRRNGNNSNNENGMPPIAPPPFSVASDEEVSLDALDKEMKLS